MGYPCTVFVDLRPCLIRYPFFRFVGLLRIFCIGNNIAIDFSFPVVEGQYVLCHGDYSSVSFYGLWIHFIEVKSLPLWIVPQWIFRLSLWIALDFRLSPWIVKLQLSIFGLTLISRVISMCNHA